MELRLYQTLRRQRTSTRFVSSIEIVRAPWNER
jgi:hypothetical protein